MSQLVVTSPLVEVTTDTRETFLRETQCHSWRDEGLALLQVIGRVIRIDASKEIVVIRIVSLDLQLVVATIHNSSTNHVALILLPLAIE